MRGDRCSQDQIDEYVRTGKWINRTFVDIFDENALTCPDKEAVVDSTKRLTWLQVKQWSDRLALKLLEFDFSSDEIILIQLPNCVDAFLAQIACRKAAIVNAQALPVFRHKEIGAVLEMTKAKGAIIPGKGHDFDHFEMLRELKCQAPALQYILVQGSEIPDGTISLNSIYQEPLEEKYESDYLKKHSITSFDTSIILLTSGTTGVPKAVEWSEAACIVGGKGILEKTKAGSNDIFGGIMPMAGASGYLSLWLAAPQVAAKTVYLEKWDPGAALKLIEQEKITTIFAAPPQLEKLLLHPAFAQSDLSTVRAIRSGAGPLSPATAIELEKRIGCRMAISSGTTETGVLASSAVDDEDDIRLYTLGTAITGMELKVVDDEGNTLLPGSPGELMVRGAGAGSGYFRDNEATLAAWGSLDKSAWFRTGDIATLDERGNLRIVGRKKDMILRGGQNIFPKIIEEALWQHPGIANVAVVGMPDKVMGEKICAYIVPKQQGGISFDEVISFLKGQKISTYMFPERIELIDSIPTITYTGKTDKKALRKDIELKLKNEDKI